MSLTDLKPVYVQTSLWIFSIELSSPTISLKLYEFIHQTKKDVAYLTLPADINLLTISFDLFYREYREWTPCLWGGMWTGGDNGKECESRKNEI